MGTEYGWGGIDERCRARPEDRIYHDCQDIAKVFYGETIAKCCDRTSASVKVIDQ